MIGWLIYTKADAAQNDSYITWFIEEAEKQSIELIIVYREQLQIGIHDKEQTILVNQIPVRQPDFIIVRTIEPVLQTYFEMLDIPTFNHSTVATLCNHKALTYLKMNSLDVPIVPTYFLTKNALPISPPLSYPFVLKEAKGRGGKQVHMIENESQWNGISTKITTNDVLIQATENIQLGKDIRVFVIGNDIIAAVLRRNKKDFRANFKLGGDAIPFTLTTDMKKMIQKIIDHFDFGLVGIDFLLSKDDQLIFNEIEDVVGSRILSETSTINLLEKYIQHIKGQLKKNGQHH